MYTYVLRNIRTCVCIWTKNTSTMSIYLDYNATTPLAPTVLERINNSLQEEWGNPSSGYGIGVKAKKSIVEARKYISVMINSAPEDIIFTSGGTEANNIVIFGIIPYFKQWLNLLPESITSEKPHVITTNVEHDAIIQPLKHLEENGNIDLTVVPVSSNGCVTKDHVLANVRPSTCLITIMLANNETGVIMPVASIGREINEINKNRKLKKLIPILYHTDAAQAIGKIKVDVKTLHVDYMTIVGHKFYAPRIGCLYVKSPGSVTPVTPLFYGGGQERGFRPGTENTAMIAGLGEAARLVHENLDAYANQMLTTRDCLEQKLKEVFGENEIVINCEKSSRLPNTCNFSFVTTGLTGYSILLKCNQLMASVGAACHSQNKPSGILLASGVPKSLAANAIRLSVGRETMITDITAAVEDLKQAVAELLGLMKPEQAFL